MDTFTKDFGVLDEEAPATSPNKNKRRAEEEVPEPDNKRSKLSQYIVEASTITDALISEASLQNVLKDAAFIQQRAGHKMCIMIKSPSEVTFAKYAYIAGFGKGTFKLLQPDALVSPLECKLTSSNDIVILAGAAVSLEKVINDMRATKPDCAICYHNIMPDESNAKKFAVEQTHRIAYVPKEDQGEKVNDCSAFGTKEEPEVWQNEVTRVLWHMRWTQEGLMPVKPAVHMLCGQTVSAGRAILLAKADS